MLKKLFNKKREFKFAENENVVCVVCNHIVNGDRDILLVTHDLEDNQWCFLCGNNDHEMSNYMLISLKQVTRIDNSVNELFKLPLDYGAIREFKNSEWKLYKQEKEE